MESKALKTEENGCGDFTEKLPETLVLEILSKLDLESLCSVAPVSKALRSSVSQTLTLIPSVDLSGVSCTSDIVSRIVRENTILQTLTLDCSRLNDTSIEYFLKEHLQELVLLKCFNFSSYIFTAIGERCPNLRLLKLELVYIPELESRYSFEKAIEQMVKGCLHLESLCVKFPDHYTSANYVYLGTVLPKTIKCLILEPVSIQKAIHPIRMCSTLYSLSLVVTEIMDLHLILIADQLQSLTELSVEDRPLQAPKANRDLTHIGLHAIGRLRNLKSLSLTRSRENCPDGFRRVNDVGMLYLAQRSEGLESVRLAGFAKVTDAGYGSVLHSCKNLKMFEIANAPFLSDLAFHDLGNTSSTLEAVKLLSCKLITSEAVRSLSVCQNLKIMDLSGCRSVSDSGLEALSTLSNLTMIDLAGSDITDSGLSSLGTGNSPITSLCLRGCKRVNDRGLSQLLHGSDAICNALTKLDLGYNPGISDRAISTISELCTKLTELCLRNCFFISDKSVKKLGTSGRQIRKLDIYNCSGLSSESVVLFSRPFFPRLRWLGAGNTRFSGKGKEKLEEIVSVRPGLSVCFSGCEMGCTVGWKFHECI